MNMKRHADETRGMRTDGGKAKGNKEGEKPELDSLGRGVASSGYLSALWHFLVKRSGTVKDLFGVWRSY